MTQLVIILTLLVIILLFYVLYSYDDLLSEKQLLEATNNYNRSRKIAARQRLKDLENKFEYDLLEKTNIEYKKVNLDIVRGEYFGEKYWERW